MIEKLVDFETNHLCHDFNEHSFFADDGYKTLGNVENVN